MEKISKQKDNMKNLQTFEEFLNESIKGTVKFKDLSIENALPFFGGGFGFKLPNSDDTSTQLMFGAKSGGHSKEDCIERLDDYKKEMIKKYPGIQNATVTLGHPKHNEPSVSIDHKPLLKDKEKFSDVKGA
jgi:hypothetical protein